MGSYVTLWRGRLQNKYHICARCGVRYPIDRMRWQLGLLLCLDNCFDTMVFQERDAERDRLVALAAQSTTELQPDRTLTDAAAILDDEVQYMP